MNLKTSKVTNIKQLNHLQREIQGSGQGEIQFWKYEDMTGCGEGACDFYFKNVVIEDEDENVQHTVSQTEHVSEKHGNKNTIDFTTVVGLNEVFEVKIPTGKDIMISFEAWDKDRSDSLENRWTDLVVPFSKKNKSEDWSSFYYYKTNNKGKKFWFKYRVTSCDPHFTGLGCNSCVTHRYGGDCSTFCRPSPGFYTCSQVGEKVCEETRTGKNCTACHEQFTGVNCEKCAENFYPEESCEVHCPSAPTRYTCNDKGQIQCLQNRTGSDCEECISNHFGEECSRFCKETDNYRCDESGGKICKEHFYPAAKCDINCEPVPGNFTCNQATGQKMCTFGKAGKNCDVCENRNKVGQSCEKCKQYFHEPECTTYCKPEDGIYNCSKNGKMICLDHTMNAKDNCREEVKIKMKVLAGGGGVIFIILVITVVIVRIRRNKNEDKVEEEVDDAIMDDENEVTVYSRVNMGTARSTSNSLHSEIPRPNEAEYSYPTKETTDYLHSNKKRQNITNKKPSPEEEATYSKIQNTQGHSAEEDKDSYACLKRDEERTNMTNRYTYKDEEDADEGTYAEVSFVRKRDGENLMKYRNNRARERADDGMETKREDATYITVDDIVKETF